MPEVISNTSSLQYLHQLGLLHVLESLAGRIIVPSVVVAELSIGRKAGIDLPDPAALAWMDVRQPKSLALLPPVAGLGSGEREVLALGLEMRDAVTPLLDRLQTLKFRMSLDTRSLIIKMAGEGS